MKIAISLSQDVSCDYICSQIQKLVTKLRESQNINQSILVIDIIQTIDGGDFHIPKLEYKPDCST